MAARLLDGTAGLWCVNAGHCRPQIVAAIQAQAARMDYATAFQIGHPGAFELGARLAALMPGDLDHVFFCNSGSEAVETALKIAIGYHHVRGEATRTRLIGRERGYHGVNFGGMSVGGIAANRKVLWPLLNGVDHLPHTHDLARNAFSRGLPAHGAELADALEHLVALHDASTIAAVIVEPVAGSTGVLVPPKGYLQRLRAICDAHGILLIFDEVITGFGRLGASFAVEKFGVVPDLVAAAKGITNAAVPMGAVFAKTHIYDAFMHGPDTAVELAHGYTYSGHPLATAAGLATLDVYLGDGLFQRAQALAPYWEDAIHSLKDARHVIDLRNIWPDGRYRTGTSPRRAGGSRLRGVRQVLRQGCAGPNDGRHDRAVAATDRREGADRPDHRDHTRHPGGDRLIALSAHSHTNLASWRHGSNVQKLPARPEVEGRANMTVSPNRSSWRP